MKKTRHTSFAYADQAATDQQGFTLIELMVTISLLAILLSIAIPSFTSTIRSNQIATTSNDLSTALNLARSEASKRGATVSACARNGNVCSGATDWSAGWLVFTDTGVLGTIDGSDTVLNTYSSSAAGMSIVSSDAAVTYTTTGALTNHVAPPTDPTFTITKTGCGANEKRIITVQTLTGRSKLSKSDCP